MSKDDYIDNIFKKGLKDLNTTPKEVVWANIDKALKTRKRSRKRVVWWRYSGAAALLLLLLAWGYFTFFNPKITQQLHNNPIVNIPINNDDVKNDSLIPKQTTGTNKVVLGNKNSIKNNSKKGNSAIKDSSNPYVTNNKKLSTINNHSKEIVSDIQSGKTTQNKVATVNILLPQNNLKIPVSDKQNNPNNVILKTPATSEKKISNNNSENPALGKNKTIEAAIATTTNNTDKPAEKNAKRWSVNPNIAPVYYNTLGKGSHLDAQFVSNKKSGDIGSGYAINISYMLNKKLSIRSGAGIVNVSYNTKDVIVYSDISGSPAVNTRLDNVKLSEDVSLISAKALSSQSFKPAIYRENNAVINQKINYFEVPMELQYNLINKRFGINLIGGVSTFILQDNDIYSEFNNNSTYLGEANNIKNVSFSTNLGIGLNYKFTEYIKLNVEPTFKYQINAYENTSGRFNPYMIGVYTGVSFKF